MATASHQLTRLALPSPAAGDGIFAVVAVVLIAGFLAILLVVAVARLDSEYVSRRCRLRPGVWGRGTG